jgi:hypothetical protein
MTNYFAELEQNISSPELPKDALQSLQSITIFDLLASGEVNGFPSPLAEGFSLGGGTEPSYLKSALKDVFLNGTQI